MRWLCSYPLLYLGIIVLMFVIIHSLRRSIREERTLDKRNVWYLRVNRPADHPRRADQRHRGLGHEQPRRRTARPEADTPSNTGFRISYAMIIMGILILFAAEVFAVGQNLSEEQKYTI